MRNVLLVLTALLAPATVLAAELPENTKTATVFVAKFDAQGQFHGWGSGFFVDEGIVVTNKHVIEGSKYFKVFSTEANGSVDLDCGRELTLSDVKINLEDDAAYIRAYIDCPHGVVRFAEEDPAKGEPVDVLGYPIRGTFAESLQLSITSGSVTGDSPYGWLTTDAYIHSGNSGGPVVQGDEVVGMAVAKTTDAEGKFVTAYFVPVSTIVKGLLYANNSTFGYTPQQFQKRSANNPYPYGTAGDPFDPPRLSQNASTGDCRQSLGDGGEASGFGGCRCKANYHREGDACVLGLDNAVIVDRPQSPPPVPAPPLVVPPNVGSAVGEGQNKGATAAPKKTLTRAERLALRKAERLKRLQRIEERRKARLRD